MSRWIRLVGAHGEVMFCDWGDRTAALPSGAIEVDRPPEPGEDYSIERGWYVPNPKALANYIAGPEHIAEAQLQKRIEAGLIKGGNNCIGLLTAEAANKGIPLMELVDQVLAKAAVFQTVELQRQAAPDPTPTPTPAPTKGE